MSTTPAASSSATSPKFSGAPMGSHQEVVFRKTSGNAIASLVLAIIGLIFVVLGIILGPLAICYANKAKKEIAERPTELDGACQAKAGFIIGIIATILSIIWIILIAITIATGAATASASYSTYP